MTPRCPAVSSRHHGAGEVGWGVGFSTVRAYQYIDGGVVPLALALEELGFTRAGSGQTLLKSRPSADAYDQIKPPNGWDKGSDMWLTQGGGWLKHRRTGTTIKLYERLGVYFFKMQFLSLKEQLRYQPGRSSPFQSPA